MNVIVHKIRLKPGVDPEHFEQWVTSTDYRACPDLPSVLRFGVHRVSADPAAPFHFFEIIHITSHEAFEADMKTPVFAGLVEGFSKMADVVEEISGGLIEPGFLR